MTRTIIIDPGHGGDDPGAVCGSLLESDMNFKMAMALGIKANSAGFAFLLTRQSGAGATLETRCAVDRNCPSSVAFIAVHFNAGPDAATGTEIFYAGDIGGGHPSQSGMALGCAIMAALNTARLGLHDRGVKPDNQSQHPGGLYVLRNSTRPAVLVECGFLTNPGDVHLFADPEFRNRFAAAVISGVVKWLG